MFREWNITVSTICLARIGLFQLKNKSSRVSTIIAPIQRWQEPAAQGSLNADLRAPARGAHMRAVARPFQSFDGVKKAVRTTTPLSERLMNFDRAFRETILHQ